MPMHNYKPYRRKALSNERISPGLVTKKVDAVNIALSFLLVYSTAYATLGDVNHWLSQILSLGSYIFIALVINAFPSFLQSFTRKNLLLMLAFTVVYIVSFAVATDMTLHKMVLSTVMRFCLPMFLLGLSVQSPDGLLKNLRMASIVILCLLYISVFITRSNQLVSYRYSQDTGYEALLPFIVLLVSALRKTHRADIIGTVLAGLMIFMSGARGPFFCAVVGTMMAILFVKKFEWQRTMLLIVGLFIVLLLFNIFYIDLLQLLIVVFHNLGVSARILEGLVNLNLADDSIRDNLRLFAWEYGKEHIVGGTGLVNDRRLLKDSFRSTAETAFGTYCHNFFFEVIMQFGLLPGLCLGGWTVFHILRRLTAKDNYDARLLMIIFTTIAFLPLMVSKSYVTTSGFYLLIGFMSGRQGLMNSQNTTSVNHCRS